MARKDESILNLLFESPWWVSVLVSSSAFVFLRFVLPSVNFQSMAAKAFVKGLSGAAGFVAIFLLIPASISALNSWMKKKRS